MEYVIETGAKLAIRPTSNTVLRGSFSPNILVILVNLIEIFWYFYNIWSTTYVRISLMPKQDISLKVVILHVLHFSICIAMQSVHVDYNKIITCKINFLSNNERIMHYRLVVSRYHRCRNYLYHRPAPSCTTHN